MTARWPRAPDVVDAVCELPPTTFRAGRSGHDVPRRAIPTAAGAAGRWGTAPEPDAAAAAYWRLSSSLHRDVAHVLTYLHDDAHADRIHVDDGLSGDGPTWFSPRSPVQVPDVQTMCRYVWGLDVEVTREWDGATRAPTEEVLDGLGVGGRLTGDGWAPFLEATARR